MALTQPFINTFSAFDATIGTQINLSVLGGDAINSYRFWIYDSTNSNVPIYSSNIINVSNDVPSTTIRLFPIDLTTLPSGTLQNNNFYYITAQTYNGENQENHSPYSLRTLFECYAQCTITPMYNGQILSNNTTIEGQSAELTLQFNTNDLNSPAQLNNAQIMLYGVRNDVSTILFVGDVLYNSPFTQVVNGFSNTLDSSGQTLSTRLYDSFTLEISGNTIEGMPIKTIISGLQCYYSTLNNSPYFRVQNLCDKGLIEITSTLTSLLGTSNPAFDDLIFVDSEAVDLRDADSWVKWQNLFSLEQPFTIRMWGSNFANGNIIELLTLGGWSINISYHNEKGYIYIALESRQTHISGQQLFPYYIESNKINANAITSQTKLFIGIQHENGLFYINLSITT